MRITAIDAGSPAEHAGVHIGETLTAVDEHATRDVLDYQFYTYDARITLTLCGGDGRERQVKVRKEEGEPLGLTFETYLADKPRHCANKCVFCFIDQMPPGMRESLYFKDDDMRLSFLQGNYISMTNLTDDDLARMIRMRISPVNVSVQTTDPELREKMLANPRARLLMEQMKRLADAHVTMNCQIVLCPGLNDGANLQKSLDDLIALYPAVASISVVPVGLTKYREGLYPLTPVGKAEANAILDIVEPIGAKCLERFGSRVVYCSDEIYLKSERPMPAAPYYDDFPQLENGVGMMALFEDELIALLENTRPFYAFGPFSLATGEAAAGFMRKMLDLLAKKCHTMHAEVYAIRNDFFGSSVNVAGLVTARDLIAQLHGKPLGEKLLIPSCMLRYGEDVFLDDLTVADVEKALGVPVLAIPSGAEGFLHAIRTGRADEDARHPYEL
ncbi:MAG: DUF512 domain-containing protein [Clostridiaceae bacterium]|nr:DUF512 domain-containing protein [Clostridiaceae bacterium]